MLNGVPDESTSFVPLETQVDDQLLKVEREMAKFARSPEFKRLQEYVESRKDFYQKYLPDGRSVVAVQTEERGQLWLTANAVVAELDAIINSYLSADEAVKNAQ